MKEVEEMLKEVHNELKNVPYLESELRHKVIDWFTLNPNKLAILISLPLDENQKYIMGFMSLCQIRGNSRICICRACNIPFFVDQIKNNFRKNKKGILFIHLIKNKMEFIFIK